MKKILFLCTFLLTPYFLQAQTQDKNVFGIRLNPNGILEKKEGIWGIRTSGVIHLEYGRISEKNYYATGITLNDLTPYLFYQGEWNSGKNWNVGSQLLAWYDYWNKKIGFLIGPVFKLNEGAANFYFGYNINITVKVSLP